MTRRALLAAALLFQTAALAEPPVLRISPVVSPIEVDGTLDELAWRGAAGVSGFLDARSGRLGEHVSQALLTYDAERLYVGFLALLPEGQAPEAPERARDDASLYRDDACEVFVQPARSEALYQIIVNAAGSIYDARDKDISWNPDFSAATGLREDGWTAELAIPFASLGADPPKTDEEWRLNICRDAHGGSPSAWSYTGGSFHNVEGLGTIIFGGPGPVLQMEPFTVRSTGGVELSLSLSNTGDSRVRTEGEVLWTGPDFRGGGPIGGGMPPNIGGSHVSFGHKIEQPGDYVVSVALSAGEEVVCRAEMPFRAERPMDLYVTQEPLLDELLLVLETRLPAAKLEGGEGQVVISDAVTDEAAMTRPLRELRPGLTEMRLDIGKLEPGDYKVRASHTYNERGETTSVSAEGEFSKLRAPTIEWQVAEDLLPPWEPVRVENGRVVGVWGRSYELAAGPLPVQIRSAGEELLSGACKLDFEAEGGAVGWQRHSLVAGPAAAVYEWRGDVPGISARTVVEYDGLMRVDLVLRPERALSVERLVVEVPLRREVARLYGHGFLSGHALRSQRWELRDEPDRHPWAGTLPEEGWAGSLTTHCWLGTAERGLALTTESAKGWRPADVERIIEMVPDGETARLRLHIFDEPVEIREPLRICFGLTATPVRPYPPPERRLWLSTIMSGPDSDGPMPWEKGARAPDDATSSLRGELSLAAWVKFAQPGGKQLFIDKWSSFQLGYEWGAGEIVLMLMGRDGRRHETRAAFAPGTNEWHHYAATCDGAVVRVYADGKPLTEGPVESEFRATGYHTLRLGANPWGNWRLAGSLDDAAILDRALTAEEVAVLAGAEIPEALRREAVAAWRFEQGADEHHAADEGRNHLITSLGGYGDGDEAEPAWGEGRFGGGLVFAPGVRQYAEVVGYPEDMSELEIAAAAGIEAVVLWGGYTDVMYAPAVRDEAHREFLRRLVEEAHKAGLKVLPYMALNYASTREPGADLAKLNMWQSYPEGVTDEDFHGFKQSRVLMCKGGWYVDHFEEMLDRLARRYEIDGVYLDCSGTKGCANPRHGHGYTGPDGETWHTYDVWGTRELTRRIYRIFHAGRREDGFVYLHHSNLPEMTQAPHADAHLTGELHYWMIRFRHLDRPSGVPLAQRLPLDLSQAFLTGRLYGVPTWFCFKHRNKEYTDGKTRLMTGELLNADEMATVMLLHDTHLWGHTPARLAAHPTRPEWPAMDEFGARGAEWVPYWRNEAARSSHESVKVSLYRREGEGALLVVANVGEEPATAALTLDAAGLGLAGKALAAEDAVSGAALEIAGGAVTVRLIPAEHRLIRVRAGG